MLKSSNIYWKMVFVIAICFVIGLSISSSALSSRHKNGQGELGADKAYIVLPEMNNKKRLELAEKDHRNRSKYLAEANAEINAFSAKLSERIHAWMQGESEALFPPGFLPPSVDNEKTRHWKLVTPEEIRPEDQWYEMPSYDPNKELHEFSPDPHVTYLKLIFIAPFGSKLLVEGDFPHARFMDYQILGPVDPEHPVTGQMGICEVPIVDVDIEPDPGHVNPFRVGADRNARKRHYHLTFDLQAGNAVKLNPKVMVPPEYRAPGNTRVGGPFAFTGPYGNNVLVPSVLWLRYYAPDKSAGPLGGVPLPKVTLQLPSGQKYWITCDKSLAVELQTQIVPRTSTPPHEPYPFLGPSLGWFKMYGIMYLHAEARGYYKSKPWGKDDSAKRKKEIRQLFLLMFNRGADASPPGDFEAAATECNYAAYLSRPMSLGPHKILVLTGKLPSFPHTRDGNDRMSRAEVRYFSITHQLGTSAERGFYGTPYGSLMDDEIVTNANGEYIIVFSRKEDRPANAQAKYGVTWQEWGGPALQTLVLRWLSVMPDWYLPKYSIHENNIPWTVGSWSQVDYDQNLVGRNRPGVMGPYHPVLHYLSKTAFESLGNRTLQASAIPQWTTASTSTRETAHKVEPQNPKETLLKLRDSFRELREARQRRNWNEMRRVADEIKQTWEALPELERNSIAAKYPRLADGIRRIETR